MTFSFGESGLVGEALQLELEGSRLKSPWRSIRLRGPTSLQGSRFPSGGNCTKSSD